MLISPSLLAEVNTCTYELFPAINAPISPGVGLLAINSDTVSAKKDNVYTFAGNVSANLDGQKVKADQVSYYPAINLVNMTGTINYQGEGISISASAINLDNQYKILNAKNVGYLAPSSKANGKAGKIYRVSDVYTKLSHSTYSTCPISQKIQDWHIKSDTVSLDHAEGWGVIKKAKLKVKNIPIAYIPRFSFALDDRRKSGFLTPYLGYKSTSGLSTYAPWYWNIAPNMDAVITPGIITNRGFWLGSEFRYLNHDFISEINVEGLYHDKEFSDKNRYLLSLKLKSHPGSRLFYGIDYSKLSDDDYIGDFKQTHFEGNTDYVNQFGFIKYQGTNWSLGALAQSFQSLVDNNDRYRLVPRIEATWNPINRNFVSLNFAHQYSHFDHPDKTKTIGDRFNTEANLSFNLSGSAYFAKPGIHIQHTSYQNLENFSTTSLERTATTYFVDAGLFFEREFDNNNWLQTFEPRIYYAKREAEDESGLPDFDTSLNTFSYNSLFTHRLYSGKDFTGELDRISLGLTSKFIHLSNNQTHLQFKLAQGYDFLTNEKTNFAFETYLRHKAWRGNIKAYTHPNNYKLETLEASLHYQPNDRLHLKTSYKFKENTRKELDLAGAWQISPKWLVYARNRQSLLSTEKRAIENLLGFEYDSCCWAINFSIKRELTNNGSAEYDNSVHLSVELKGLTGKRDTKEVLSDIFN